MQHARAAGDQRRRVMAGVEAVAGRFDADQLHRCIVDIRIEDAHRVRAAADARNHRIGLPAREFGHLHLALVADHALEVAHHHRVRVRVRARDRADDVERVLDVGDPVAHRFVQRVLQRARARFDRHDGRAEQLHPVHVRGLAAHVLGAHVDDALHPEARADRRGRDAVLAGAGFGDHALLAHPLREQRLADHVVDLVRAGVVQVLALQVDLRAAERLAPALRVIDRRRTADEVLQLALEFGDEIGVVLVFRIRAAQFVQRVHQRLGDERAAIRAEMAAIIRKVVHGVSLSIGRRAPPAGRTGLHHPASASRTARTNAAIRA
ncbi:hypothetical protein FEQ05_05940 [Burkholderia pseudomultivorans]|nr:hypothetical protein [Burkholderia pseudomultivorans]